MCVRSLDAASFEILITQSPPGPQNSDPANWMGVLQYHATGTQSGITPATGIASEAVSDPAGLGFRATAHEVFVGNRHGNTRNSSISRFLYDFSTRQLIPNGAVTGNGLFGVHQVAFNPVTGEMFAANVQGGVSRFTFDAQDNPVANGIIGNGSTRGVAVSPDGKRLFVTMGINSTIRQFDLTTGAELPSVNVPSGVGGLHYMKVLKRVLYVAGFYDNRVYRYRLNSSNELSLLDHLDVNDPLGLDFSPDGNEMFVTGHESSSLLYRFRWNPNSQSWIQSTTLDAGSSLGDIIVLSDHPYLRISLDESSNNIVLAWPISARNYILQTSPSLIPSTSWTNLTPTQETNATSVVAKLPPPNSPTYFRLVAPGAIP